MPLPPYQQHTPIQGYKMTCMLAALQQVQRPGDVKYMCLHKLVLKHKDVL